VPDGRIRLFDRLISVASFPIGIDPTNFAKARRARDLVQARSSVRRVVGIDRLDYTVSGDPFPPSRRTRAAP
jgi:trehalose-6-phosphate synthase